MAKRYIGDAVVTITYHDAGDYRGTVTAAHGFTWRFRDLHAPATGLGAGVAYDSPEAYDKMASSAVGFASYYTTYNRGDDVPDWAPPAEIADAIEEATVWAMDDRGEYEVRRSRSGSEMSANPRRPPKQWMRDCVAGASKSARNPGAVCGALWYHKMSPAQRRAALRREGKDAAALANPSTGATIAWVAGTVAVLGIGYLLLRPKPAAASTAQQPALPPVPNTPQQPQAPQQPPVPPNTFPPLGPPAGCNINMVSFTAWAASQGLVPLYVPTAGPPPAYTGLPGYSTQLQYTLRTKVVVMTADNRFWVYYAGDDSPHEAFALVQQYCATAIQGPIFQFAHGVPSRMEWVT